MNQLCFAAVIIGNGLGRNKETLIAVKEFLKKVKLPCVIDADGIYALDKKIMKKNFIVTPHAHEFYILTKEKLNAINQDLIEIS